MFNVSLKRTVDDSYDVEIGFQLENSLITDLSNGLCRNVRRYALITDSNLVSIYAIPFLERLRQAGINVELFPFSAGEANKTRETKAMLEDRMINAGFGRDSAVIALGGGVVSDLAGFLAGTYARGLPFLVYSTTLLSAADASIGGKTAVDTPHATNLIGLFHQPRKVYVDVDSWKTLPPREISAGLAETIKHACLADSEFFGFLEKHIKEIFPTNGDINREVALHIAKKNCEIKYKVVKEDVLEDNYRQVLNLGHTVGRALEPLAGFNLLHGEAVAIGLVVQLKLGLCFGYVSDGDLSRVVALLREADLPVSIPTYINKEDLLAKLYTDKKVRKNAIRFVFQKGIGDVMQFEDGSYSREISENEIRAVLERA